MRTLLALVVVLDVYVIVFCRLMVKHDYDQAHGVREGTFGALFGFPPYARLPEAGRR